MKSALPHARRHGRFPLTLLLVLACLALVGAQETPELLARAVARDLAAGAFDKVTARFNPQMTAALPATTLASGWQRVVAQNGPFKSVSAAHTDVMNTLQHVALTLAFERADALLTVVLDGNARIAGLTITPVPAR